MSQTLTVGVAEAHNRLSELLDQVARGTDVVIARRGTPVGRLVRASSAPEPGQGARVAELLAQRLACRRGAASEQELETSLRRERETWDR